MGRHTIPTLSNEFMVVVGWDNPMHTYFAQVERVATSEKEHEAPVMLWLGGTPDGVPSAESSSRAFGSVRDTLRRHSPTTCSVNCTMIARCSRANHRHNCSAPTSICFEAAVDPGVLRAMRARRCKPTPRWRHSGRCDLLHPERRLVRDRYRGAPVCRNP